MSITKPRAARTDNMTQPTRRNRNTKVATHYKKWWWAHASILVALALVVVLPIMYVGYPQLAQKQVGSSTLEITDMRIRNPTPTSFTLHQRQVIGSRSSFHPQIHSFEASVSLLGASVPFAKVQVPAVKTEDGVAVEVDQVVELGDGGAFGEFARAFMMDDIVQLEVSGRPSLRQGELPEIEIDYEKLISIKGLNNLDGFNLTEYHILVEGVNGRNLNGTVLIPNPSVVTVELGNITLNLGVDGHAIGYSYIDNLTLIPGDNSIPMTSSVNISAILELVYSEEGPYQNDAVPFQVTGNSSEYHGEQLSYFTKALRATNLTVELNVSRAVAELGRR